MAYCTRADIEAVYGRDNVTLWSTFDGVSSRAIIDGRITAAIAAAQDEIDARLRGGLIAVPFTTVPTIIKSITAKLAGHELHQTRQNVDAAVDDNDTDPIAKACYEKLRDIKAGVLVLSTTPAFKSYPEAITYDE